MDKKKSLKIKSPVETER
jgi:hypothetical protein